MFLTDYPAIFGAKLDGGAPAVTEITISAPPPSAGIRSPRHQMYSDLPTPIYTNQSFQSLVPGFQPIAGQRSTYAPEQFNQNYHSGMYPHSQTPTADGYGSLNASVHTTNSSNNLSVNAINNKKNRRESSMLGLGVPGLVQQRKSMIQVRDRSSSRHTPDSTAAKSELSMPDEVDGPMAKGLW